MRRPRGDADVCHETEQAMSPWSDHQFGTDIRLTEYAACAG